MDFEQYYPKDFIETAEGLCFAVVQQGVETSGEYAKVLCVLRYIKDDETERWQKVSTGAANAFLGEHHPEYLYYSQLLDVSLHGVDVDKITRRHCPRLELQAILSNPAKDQVEQDLSTLCRLFESAAVNMAHVGVTGSLLIGAQGRLSDLDLVFYDRDAFGQARAITSRLIEQNVLGGLSEADWREAYDRRGCSLNFGQYVWHEQRKFNKGLVNGRKFDLNFVGITPSSGKTFRKMGHVVVQCRITDDVHSFDFPAQYGLNHSDFPKAVCFTATYVGQAYAGEWVEIAGLLEQDEDGDTRIVVGSSREAPGEYIKVLSCPC